MTESTKKIVILLPLMDITAKYQRKGLDGTVECILCPHNCVLKEGQKGVCRTRVNMDGELISTAYGNLSSVAVDPIEKKPLFHFLPGSDIFSLAINGCNFRCLNCQNWRISQLSPDEDEENCQMPEDVVNEALRHKNGSIAFTYSEPTVFYEFMLDVVRIAKGVGLKTVIVSNGYINREPLLELCNWLDAANIDIKCFDASIYKKLTGGSLKPVLKTLGVLREKGVWLEITNLIIPGWSDDIQTIKRMCEWLYDNGFSDTPLHFSRFFPAHKMSDLQPTPEKIMLQAREIAHKCGIKYVYLGNISINGGQDTACPLCGTIAVRRDGFIVSSNLGKNGECPTCGYKIPGIWS